MIYFLENDANIRKLVCYALSREGYEIKGFSLTDDFRKRIKNEIPELVLLDIVQDGVTILKEMRENKKYANIPVIMLTANGSEFDGAAGLDIGADDYIAKPFGVTELVSRVCAALGERRNRLIKEEYRLRRPEFFECENTGCKTGGVSE